MQEDHENDKDAHVQDLSPIDGNNAADDDQDTKSGYEDQYLRQGGNMLFPHQAVRQQAEDQGNQDDFHDRHGHSHKGNFDPLAGQAPDDERHHNGRQQRRTSRNGNGQGDIRDFPGNYTQYRDWKDAKVHQEKEKEKEAAKAQEDKTAKVRLNEKRRMSFKEKREFEQLEQEIADLETEKNAIEEALCSGTLSVDELTEKSKRLPELSDLIDEKTLRWLELSEIESN